MVLLKIFRRSKKVDRKSEKIKINFREAENFLEEETRKIKYVLKGRVKKFKENFIKNLEELDKEFNNLYYANFEKLILEDKRDVSNIIETSRRNYCNKSKELISKTKDFLKNTNSPIEIREAVFKTFNRLNTSSKEVLILATPFKKQIEKISTNLKKLKEEIDAYDSFLNSEYSIIQKEEEAKNLIEKIRKVILEQRKKEIERIETKKKIKKLKEELKSKSFALEKLEKSEKANKLKELEKMKGSLELEKENIILETANLISSISRQIKAYIHKKNLGKFEEAQLKEILNNPKRIFEGNFYLLDKTISSIRRELNKLERDEKKRKKFLVSSEEISNNLGIKVAKYRELLEELAKISDEINKIKVELKIEERKQEIENLSREIERLEKEKIEAAGKEEIKELIEKLQELLSNISGKKIEIKYAGV